MIKVATIIILKYSHACKYMCTPLEESSLDVSVMSAKCVKNPAYIHLGPEEECYQNSPRGSNILYVHCIDSWSVPKCLIVYDSIDNYEQTSDDKGSHNNSILLSYWRKFLRSLCTACKVCEKSSIHSLGSGGRMASKFTKR